MAVGDLIKSLKAQAETLGMSEEALYLEDLIKLTAAPKHGVDDGHDQRGEKGVVPVCATSWQQKLTPASPVIFDALGKDKNALFQAKGVFEIDVYMSCAMEAKDGEGVGTGVPEAPEGWMYLGEIIGVEPIPYYLSDLMPDAMTKISRARWVQFDMKRGISPDITMFGI